MSWDFPAELEKDSQFFTIKTERLSLRLLEQADVPLRFGILEKYPEITDFMTFDPPKDISETQAHFEVQQESFSQSAKIAWTIMLEDKLIGTIGLEDIVWKSRAWEYNKGEIGYWMNPEFQGQGFMTEALIGVMKFSFQKLQLNKIEIGHASRNMASQRVIEKAGFRLVGVQRNHFRRFGEWWDHKRYELLSSEYANSIQSTSYLDLTLSINNDMPVYPGDRLPNLHPAKTIEDGGWGVTQLDFGSHDGTHVNVPAHIDAKGLSLDDFNLETFMGQAVIYETDDDIKSGVGIIFRDQIVDIDLAQKIAEIGPKFVGLSCEFEWDIDAERYLLERNVISYERLANTDKLPKNFYFVGLPLRIEGGDGSPVRAYAKF